MLQSRAMETLGLSNASLKSEGRLKSLFWPSVRTSNDVDYLGSQGFWVCLILAVLSFVFAIFTAHPVAGAFIMLFYYLGGVGVREHSRYAAAVVLVMYIADSLTSFGNPVLRLLIAALLLSNLRATWIASRWKPESNEAVPAPRFDETWTDKFADKFPMWLWPKLRIPYYIFSVCLLLLVVIGLAIIRLRS
ncbi:MAG TPA: hypothetical protein VGT03_09980 [Candidatus Acidoferrales bacterium]|nr:hypothetical protein [Candidatus Acidoferrales bacterium]